MPDKALKTCVVFKSSLFSFTWPEISSDLADPWGEDLAAFLGDALRELERINRADSPYKDEGGWSFEVVVNHERYDVFVHWLPFGQPPIDYWAIQVRPLPKRIGWLFSRKSNHMAELLEMIADVLSATEGISDVQWMTFDEFARIY